MDLSNQAQQAVEWAQRAEMHLAAGFLAGLMIGAGAMFLFVLIRRKIKYGRAFGEKARPAYLGY